MTKVAQQYLDVDPWIVRETGFHPERSKVSESIFALANEYMGVRGCFEEGYSGEGMVGSFFNGVFEEESLAQLTAFSFKGLIARTHGIANAVNWLHTRISIDGEELDLARSCFREFVRQVDLRTGVLTRSFVWETASGKRLRVTFFRLLSMVQPRLGCQKIALQALNFSGRVDLRMGLDFGVPQYTRELREQWVCERKEAVDGGVAILGRLPGSGHCVMSSMRVAASATIAPEVVESEKSIGLHFSIDLRETLEERIERVVVNGVGRRRDVDQTELWDDTLLLAKAVGSTSFDAESLAQEAFWKEVWQDLDVAIVGDDENQQGIRFCLFQLYQSYHGLDPSLNVTAKGLTSEYYYGWAWWDTETYCLPFYMFNNPKAARNLLEYRYLTLAGALERAQQKGCDGARYPMGTIDGTEAVPVWQHGDLEIHVSAAVAYGIWHYVKTSGDTAFLAESGLEILLQICRYYASRGQWSPKTGEFGFWGVMGADEFHMMVHNNYYTNFMARRAFEFTLEVLDEMERKNPADAARIKDAVQLRPNEAEDWATMASAMRLNQDAQTGLCEQHDGYFDMPHLDLSKVPPEQFPLYKNWPYLKIFRWDFIKQPDVLLVPFFFGSEFSLEEKRVNYEYYEPRCMHESSLSPCIHSILAAELGKEDDAYRYFGQATRLDLDDYNRNTWEGLHTTSMAGAYMNIVYGFGGLRSDGPRLSFKPSLPTSWDGLRFKLHYRGTVLSVSIEPETVSLTVESGADVEVDLFDETVTVSQAGVQCSMQGLAKQV